MTESDAPISPPSADQNGAEPKPKGGAGKLVAILLLIVVVAIVVAGVVFWPQVERQSDGATAPNRQVEELRQELAATRVRLADLDARLKKAPAPATDADLDRRVALLEGAAKAQPTVSPRLADDVKALADGVAELRKTAADSATVLRLADRLAKVEGELHELQARRSSGAALLLAVGQLRAAVDQALPFDAELRALKALAPDDAETAKPLTVLKPRAATGIPTRLALVERFAQLEPAIVRAEALPAGDGWWRQSLNRLMTLVIVRREDGDADGIGAAAVVARVRARLAVNDFAAAIAEAATLTEGPAETAKGWLDDARARLAADQALSELAAQAVAATGARP